MAFDRDAGHPVQPGRQVPVPRTEQFHAGRDEDCPDDRGIEEDGDREAEAQREALKALLGSSNKEAPKTATTTRGSSRSAKG